MPPFLGGGGMIREVFDDRATWAPLPEKFDAGTPNVADSIALGAALDYLDESGHGQCARARDRRDWLCARAAGQRAGRERLWPARSARFGRASCRSTSRACTRTMRARSSTRQASPCARATTAASRCTAAGRGRYVARELLHLQLARRGRCAGGRAEYGAAAVPAGLNVVPVGPHAAVRLLLRVHWLATEWAARPAGGDDLGDVAAQRVQLIAGGAAGERRGLAGLLFF